MQALQNCIRRLPSISCRPSSVLALCGEYNNAIIPFTIPLVQKLTLHTTSYNQAKDRYPIPKRWPKYNEKIYPPQSPEEERRPAVKCTTILKVKCTSNKLMEIVFFALTGVYIVDHVYVDLDLDENDYVFLGQFICHMKTNIKYSPKKMWYIACLVRGMSVDEAVRQLSFVPRKGAVFAKETILEAQQLAVEKHNVEFKSNLWVAESFVGKAFVIKGMRRHAKRRMGMVEYKYIHYFVRLEEGPPPKEYYFKLDYSGPAMLERWLTTMRDRTIKSSL